MPLQKLISLGGALASRNLLSPTVKSRVIPKRQRNYYLACPPRHPCSNAELTIFSVIITFSISFIPAWIIFHMKDYGAKADKS